MQTINIVFVKFVLNLKEFVVDLFGEEAIRIILPSSAALCLRCIRKMEQLQKVRQYYRAEKKIEKILLIRIADNCVAQHQNTSSPILLSPVVLKQQSDDSCSLDMQATTGNIITAVHVTVVVWWSWMD